MRSTIGQCDFREIRQIRNEKWAWIWKGEKK